MWEHGENIAMIFINTLIIIFLIKIMIMVIMIRKITILDVPGFASSSARPCSSRRARNELNWLKIFLSELRSRIHEVFFLF